MFIKSKFYPKIFFFLLSLAIVLLAFYMTRQFLPALLTGALIAYLSYPLYKKLSAVIKNKTFASLLVTVFIVLLIAVPVIVALGLLSAEAYSAYTTLTQHNLGTNFLKIVCRDEASVSCRSIEWLVSFLPEKNLDYYLQATIEKILGFITENASNFLIAVPSIFLNFFVMAFVIYYLLKDGDGIANKIKSMLPLKEAHKERVLTTFHDITYGVFYGNISVAVIQGILGSIGFLILGIPSPFLWGFVMMLFALIPYFGTAIIWLPAALNLVFIGYLQNDNSFIIRGIILIAYGTVIISWVDNILKPRLIGSKAHIHPILVLLGVLGGLSLFGFLGLVLGPIMLALLMTLVDIYDEEKSEIDEYF